MIADHAASFPGGSTRAATLVARCCRRQQAVDVARGKRRSRGGVSRGRESPQRAGGAPEGGKATYSDWVWWPNEQGRRSRAQEEFQALPGSVRAELLARISRFLKGESRYKDVKNLGDGVLEIRHREGNNHYRVLFFIDGDVCVGLTCFYKNQNKTEKNDLDRAKSRKSKYR